MDKRSRHYSATEARQALRFSRKRSQGIFISALTSGPLMALLAFGIVGVLLPAERFGPTYDNIFAIAPPIAWGIVSLAISITGYVGLFRGSKKLWMVAHGFAVFLFGAIALLAVQTFITSFVVDPVAATACPALAANAWARSTGHYRDHFASA